MHYFVIYFHVKCRLKKDFSNIIFNYKIKILDLMTLNLQQVYFISNLNLLDISI